MLSALATSHKVGIVAIAALFIAYALVCSFLLPRLHPNFPGKRMGLFIGVSVVITAAMLGSTIVLAAEPTEPREAVAETTPAATTTTTTAPTPAPTPAAGDPVAGKVVFTSAGCVSCHTLKAAAATGKVGPNLDERMPPAALVIDRVTHGKGIMPPFSGQLSAKQIQDVAAFVSTSAGNG